MIKSTGQAATPFEASTRVEVPRCRWEYVSFADDVYGGTSVC
jgi:hypothetical protein